jgi:hypothetical protein
MIIARVARRTKMAPHPRLATITLGAFMTNLTQVPFADVSFVDNPEPRCPCILLLDTSGSMAGQPIAQLNAGLKQFQQELAGDPLAAKRVVNKVSRSTRRASER